MSIVIDLWQLLAVLASLIVALGTFATFSGKLLVSQFEKRLDSRFESQENRRKEASQHWDVRFSELDLVAVNSSKELQRVERDLLKFQAEMPVNYVRRDDYIRNQTVLESKLDGLAIRIENAILKGNIND